MSTFFFYIKKRPVNNESKKKKSLYKATKTNKRKHKFNSI